MQRPGNTQPGFVAIQYRQAVYLFPDPSYSGTYFFRKLVNPVLNGAGTDGNLEHSCQQIMNPLYANHSNGR